MSQATYYPAQSAVHESSQSLVEAAKREREAFAQLYTIYAPQLYRYFWFHTRSQLAAEDLVSEAFLRVLSSLASYDSRRGPFTAWLYGIARHALARYKWQAAHSGAARQAARAAAATDGHNTAPGEERIDLWQAVAELSESEREVIALKFGGGLTHREIAVVTGLREVHVGVVLGRALQKLRGYLSDEGYVDAQ